jgi:hypothetical protein
MAIQENKEPEEFDPLYFLDGEWGLPGEWVEEQERLMRARMIADALVDDMKDAEAIFPRHDPIASWRFRRALPTEIYHEAKFDKQSFLVGVRASKKSDLEITDALRAIKNAGKTVFSPKQFWLGIQVGRSDTAISLWAAVELRKGWKTRRGK